MSEFLLFLDKIQDLIRGKTETKPPTKKKTDPESNLYIKLYNYSLEISFARSRTNAPGEEEINHSLNFDNLIETNNNKNNNFRHKETKIYLTHEDQDEGM